jgi:hypothetical protein
METGEKRGSLVLPLLILYSIKLKQVIMKTKFYLDLAIQCGLVRRTNCPFTGNITVGIPFRDDRNLSIVKSSDEKKAEMKERMGGRDWTGLYETLGYEVWDFDKGILPNGGPCSMSEDMINDLVNTHLKKMGKDISFIIPVDELEANYLADLAKYGEKGLQEMFEAEWEEEDEFGLLD